MAQGTKLENKPKLIDSSDSLFSMYNQRKKEHDEKMTDNWKDDAKGILVFTGLFSVIVAQFLGSSLQNLQLDPQNASSFYLGHTYRLTSGSNVSSIPFDDPATFKPPTSAIWVSALWSLSLVFSLTCALLATLMQKWARRYLDITQKRNDPQRRAQIRELLSQALKKQVRLSWMIEILPFLLHTSVFLFLSGFVLYLFSINELVAKVAAACAGTSLLSYLYVSAAPIYSRDSPYSTPLTTLVWVAIMGSGSLLHRLHYSFAYPLADLAQPGERERVKRIRNSFHSYHERMLKGITMDVESLADNATNLASEILKSTFKSLDGDSDVELFLSCIPGFYKSKKAEKHCQKEFLNEFNSQILPLSIISLIEHVLSSDLFVGPEKEAEKEATVTTCLKAIEANAILLECTFREALQNPDSVIFTHPGFVRLAAKQLPRTDVRDPEGTVKNYAQCVVAVAINRTQFDDDIWSAITERYLRPHHAQYREDPRNLKLCNLICLTKYLKTFCLGAVEGFKDKQDWHKALVEAGTLEVTGIAHELRDEFLRLWDGLNGVANDAPNGSQLRQNATLVCALLNTVKDALLHPSPNP